MIDQVASQLPDLSDLVASSPPTSPLQAQNLVTYPNSDPIPRPAQPTPYYSNIPVEDISPPSSSQHHSSPPPPYHAHFCRCQELQRFMQDIQKKVDSIFQLLQQKQNTSQGVQIFLNPATMSTQGHVATKE